MGKINVEAEKNELILENEFGDKVIIPAKKRQWVQKQIEKGNHADLDNYISTLPIKSDFAEEGSVVPGDPTKKVKVYTGKPEYFVQGVAPRNGERKNEDGSVSTHSMSYTSADDVHYAYPTLFQDGDKWIQLDDKDDWAAFKEAQKRKELFKFDNEEDAKKFAEGSWKTENIKEYDIDSPEYRELYNSGAIANYDKNSDTYILSKPLDEVVITAEAPQWAKDKRKYESQYTKDWYIDNKMPKFSRSMGVSATNMHSNNVKEYDDFINNKIVEDIFKRKPTFETDYSKDRLKTLQGFSQKELELIKNSKYAYRIEPSIWSKFEQGLLSVGNTGSSVQFKNPSLSQEEAKKEDNPLNILQPLSIPTKMVQSAYKDNYSLKDALKGKQNNANVGEDVITDPLNLVGLGIWNKLSKAGKFAKLEDVYQAVKGLSKEEAIGKLSTIQKEVKPFESEIDWNKWNKEIPDNKLLLSEYHAIEEATKNNKTWMKNPDGSEYNGTPEQFIQELSTNFKKAFPDGFEKVYRGVNSNNPELISNKSIFTADESLASDYAPYNRRDNIIDNNSSTNEGGVYNFYRKNSKNSIELDANNSSWTNIDLTDKRRTKEYFEKNIQLKKEQIEKTKKDMQRLIQLPDGSWEDPLTGGSYRISNELYKNHVRELEKNLKVTIERYKNIDNLVSNPKELEKMRKILGDIVTTDDIAEYIEKNNLDYVKLKNIEDSGYGDVTIVNHKPNNYLKSSKGNNGMFDMNNPNIFKGLIPPALLYYLQSQQNNNEGKKP